MNAARIGSGPMPAAGSNSRSASKLCSWRPKALRRATASISPRCSRSQTIIPAQVPRIGRPASKWARIAGSRPSRSIALRDRRALAAGDHERVEPGEVLGRPDLAGVGAELGEDPDVGGEVALAGQDADAEALGGLRPGTTSRAAAAARPRRRARRCRRRASGRRGRSRRRATRSGSLKWVVASTTAFAVRSGSADLKIPEPTKLPSAPSCIVSDASAGVAMPPAQNSGTGSQPRSATSRTTSSGARSSFASAASSIASSDAEPADAADDLAQVADGLDDVAGPGLALGADHRRALADPPQRLAEVGGAADERDVEGELVDVVGLVGRGQDLGLVDVVDLEGLQDLGLGEVADPRLRHHRDRHRLLDLLDHPRVRHPGDAAVAADVGGDALERHHGAGAGRLGDAGLLGVGDVHDHAALEHLGEAGLEAEGGVLGHGAKYRGSSAE